MSSSYGYKSAQASATNIPKLLLQICSSYDYKSQTMTISVLTLSLQICSSYGYKSPQTTVTNILRLHTATNLPKLWLQLPQATATNVFKLRLQICSSYGYKYPQATATNLLKLRLQISPSYGYKSATIHFLCYGWLCLRGSSLHPTPSSLITTARRQYCDNKLLLLLH